MNCQEYRNLIEDTLDVSLHGEPERRVRLHIEHCAACRSYFQSRRNEHIAFFSKINASCTDLRLPDGFADRLAASVRARQSVRRGWRRLALPKWALIAASVAVMAGFVFAATVVVDAVVGEESGEETKATEGTIGTEGTSTDSETPALVSDVVEAPFVPSVASVPSTEPDNQQPTTDGQLKGESKMNIKHRAAAALAAATLAATPASATELPWAGGDATLGDGKVTILCDGSGNVTNIVAKPTGGEELRITGSAMTFADGAKVSLASPASGEFADGRLVFANDVTAEGALTLNRTDGAFMIWSGNRLVGVEWVNAFAANGSQASDWAAHSAYAVPTDAGISENELPYGIYRPTH